MGRQRFFGNKAHGLISIGGGATHDLADGDLITIGDVTYEIDEAADGVTGGNVAVDTSGDTTATQAAATLLGVINANKPSVPVTATAHPGNADIVLIVADNRGGAGNMVFTATFANTSTISGSGLLQYGENGGSQIEARGQYDVEAEDVTATVVVIDTGLTSPRFPTVEIRDSAGDFKAWDGALSVVGGQLRLDASGTTDLAAGDTIVWGAWE
jgi:hypothetical protein